MRAGRRLKTPPPNLQRRRAAGATLPPARAGSRLAGPAIMQRASTWFGEMVLDGGQVTKASPADYKTPGMLDIPPMENTLVAATQRNGPFGAKGLGESGTFGVSPAIANAIHDAIGVRLTSLPLTAEAVLRAIREQEGRPLDSS